MKPKKTRILTLSLLIILTLSFCAILYFNMPNIYFLKTNNQNKENNDKNKIIKSASSSSANSVSYLVKLNITWGGTSEDIGTGVAMDSKNNIYLSGYTHSFGVSDYDAFLVKYNTVGTLLWYITWGGEYADAGTGVAIDSENNIYLCGETGSFGSGGYDAFLAKYTSNGIQLWNTTWGGASDDEGFGVAVDSENNVYLSGYTQSFGAGSNDAFLVKFNVNGTQIWNTTWGGISNDRGYDVVSDRKNNVYLCGETMSFGVGNGDAFLVKYNTNGSQLWNATWGGTNYDGSDGAVVDSDNNIFICGKTESFGAGSSDAFLVKYSTSGVLLWNTIWGGISFDVGNDITVDGENNLYLCGYTASFGEGSNDAFLVKYEETKFQLSFPVYVILIVLGTVAGVKLGSVVDYRHKKKLK